MATWRSFEGRIPAQGSSDRFAEVGRWSLLGRERNSTLEVRNSLFGLSIIIRRSSFNLLFSAFCLLSFSTPLWSQSAVTLSSSNSPSVDPLGKASAQPAQEAGQPLKSGYPSLAGLTARGPANAPVTIIEFSDFECPFCARVEPVIGELLTAYPNRIRFIFKHNPLPMHAHATLAHEAALAAGAQGKFWEMHDLLFANQQRLERDHLVEYAKQLNLDLVAFQQVLDSHQYRSLIEENLAEGRGLGVNATPTCFINGRRISGAQSLVAFKRVIDEALGLTKPVLGADNKADAGPEPRKEISIGLSPVRGSPAAQVTIVEFADFQCPFCARAVSVLQQLLAEYPDKVKWVFKHFPLDSHRDSVLAHQAAVAAEAQGKFWEMHDRIFANLGAAKRDDLLGKAKGIGLDMNRFAADLDSGRYKALVDADQAEAGRLGVHGTPTFFINGKELVGALPLAQFRGMVDAELQAAVAPLDVGAPLVGALGVAPSFRAAPAGLKPGATESVPLSKGPEGAPVTIVWYSDLESPLSPKAAELIRQVMNAYSGKVRLIFKNCPMEFHAEATLAHEAALAAGAEGKFWEMHDLILENQKALSKADLVGYAARLGLDRKKFAAALDGHRYRPKVEDDLAEAKRLQVFGVPAFFVSGKRVDGIQPLSVFKEIIDAQLKQVVAQNL